MQGHYYHCHQPPHTKLILWTANSISIDFQNMKRFSRIFCTKESFIDICSYIVHWPMRSSKYHILCLLPRSRGPVPPQKAIIRYFQASRTSRLSIAGWRISASRNTSPSSPRRVTTCQQYRGCEYIYNIFTSISTRSILYLRLDMAAIPRM